MDVALEEGAIAAEEGTHCKGLELGHVDLRNECKQQATKD